MGSVSAQRGGPIVEVLPPVAEQLPPLDPLAAPQTPLGALRARYFPIWEPAFDRAFPPTTCGSAWELDAIATPVSGIDAAQYGDAAAMAALGVMRYEFQVSRALAEPVPLAQLCVAVGSADPARAEALQQLKALIETRDTGEASGIADPGSSTVAFPTEVTILAASPSAVLAVACTTADPGQSRLAAYLLRVVQGREDRVVDVSYRVSQVESRSANDCSGMQAWEDEWNQHVAAWIAEGQAWVPDKIAVSVEQLCTAPGDDGARDCPQDWTN